MGTSTKSYPFPVLGNEDDINGKFNPSLSYTLEPKNVIINCDFELSNPTIEEFIKENMAAYFVQIECSSTVYRRTFTSHEDNLIISIDAGEVRDRVEVSFSICALQNMTDYSPAGVHPELEGEPIAVEKGDILADGGRGYFMADKTFDPMKAPVSSFMKIKEAKEQSGPMSIDFGDDQIIIKLSKSDYKKYLFTKKYATSTLHSSLVLPALIDALYTIKYHADEYEGQPWFSRIQQICRDRSINIDEPLIAAQKMLGYPIDRGLAEVNKLTNDENEDGL